MTKDEAEEIRELISETETTVLSYERTIAKYTVGLERCRKTLRMLNALLRLSQSN